MKTILFCCALALLLYIPGGASAQKAFEMLKYTARQQQDRFELQLADGYPAGSKVILRRKGEAPLEFLPESGDPAPGGQFLLLPFNSSNPARVIVMWPEEGGKADTVSASYIVGKKTVRLRFARK